MDLISDFMCADAGQRLTVAVLFIALVLNLLSFALKLFDLFLRSSGQDEEDDFSQQGWSMMRKTTGRDWRHDGTSDHGTPRLRP